MSPEFLDQASVASRHLEAIQLRRIDPPEIGHSKTTGRAIDQPAIKEVYSDGAVFVFEFLLEMERAYFDPHIQFFPYLSNKCRGHRLPFFYLSTWELPHPSEVYVFEATGNKDPAFLVDNGRDNGDGDKFGMRPEIH